MSDKMKVSPIQSRAAILELVPGAESAPAEIRAALSSAEPVSRFYGQEVLEHSADAIDMSRAEAGLPLTVNHSELDITSPRLPVGRVRGISLGEDGKLRGTLDIDTDDEGAALRGKIERGITPDVSITYRVLAYDGPDDDGVVNVTRWQPQAVSVVTVPADNTVGVGRSLDVQEAVMAEKEQHEAAPASVVDTVKARSQAGFMAGVEDATKRFNEIQDVTDQLSRSQPHLSPLLLDLAREARADTSITIDAYRAQCLALFGTDVAPANPVDSDQSPVSRSFAPPRGPGDARGPMHIQAGAVHGEKMARGMTDAMFQRVGGKIDDAELEGNEWRGVEMLDMARACLEADGISLRGMSRERISRAAISQGSRAISPGTANYETADFPAITENVITKLVVQGYSSAPVTWTQFCSSREVPDFKQFTMPRKSSMIDLPVVAENAAYTDLTQVDAKEAATLVKHGGVFSLTWEAVANDDQGIFEVAVDMGETASRTVDKKGWAVLTDNGNMGDTNPLFDAVNHSNLGSAALDLPGIIATRTAMARQTDDQGGEYYALLRYLLVPEELRDTADNLANSEYLPVWNTDGTAEVAGAQRVNTVRSTFTVISTVRLTDTNNWYAAADRDTVEIAFLSGNRMPALFRDEGWDTDAMHWKIRHPSVAYARNWRGLYSNVVA